MARLSSYGDKNGCDDCNEGVGGARERKRDERGAARVKTLATRLLVIVTVAPPFSSDARQQSSLKALQIAYPLRSIRKRLANDRARGEP